jgi:hypothetical protein
VWMLNNRTPYSAERSWTLDKESVKSWVVVVKGTFDILADGSTTLAAEQEPPLLGPVYRGEPGKSSLLYEMDLVHCKKNTDVLLNGHACSPRGEPAREVVVEMSVGTISKQLLVLGDRRWVSGPLGGLSMSPPEPFVKMPLTYERAFGGWDNRSEDPSEHRLEPRNPIGAGFATRREHLVDQPLPNVEEPRRRIGSWKDRPSPAGFGAIASYWTPRKEYAGTYDEKWMKDRFPMWPEDFDIRFFQAAPEDQQASGFLRGGEGVELTNVDPKGTMVFSLPRITLGFTTSFGKERVHHAGTLHTVILEPDRPRLILVWHTRLACHHRADELDETLIFEKERT